MADVARQSVGSTSPASTIGPEIQGQSNRDGCDDPGERELQESSAAIGAKYCEQVMHERRLAAMGRQTGNPSGQTPDLFGHLGHNER